MEVGAAQGVRSGRARHGAAHLAGQLGGVPGHGDQGGDGELAGQDDLGVASAATAGALGQQQLGLAGPGVQQLLVRAGTGTDRRRTAAAASGLGAGGRGRRSSSAMAWSTSSAAARTAAARAVISCSAGHGAVAGSASAGLAASGWGSAAQTATTPSPAWQTPRTSSRNADGPSRDTPSPHQ